MPGGSLMNDLLKISGLENDIAFGWINALFPEGDTAYGAAFATFSSSMAFLGALLLGFFVVIGIVSSAHSGKVLGEKYHQIWAPLRVVLGFGMMIPLAGGLSSVHYMLKDVVAPAAINLGNAPIVAYIDHMGTSASTINVSTFMGANIVEEIVSREVCAAAWNGVYSKLGYAAKAISTFDSKGLFASPEGMEYTDGHIWAYGACGNLILTKTKIDNEEDSKVLEYISKNINEFYYAHVEIVSELIEEIRRDLGLEGNQEFYDYISTVTKQETPTDDVVSELTSSLIVPNELARIKQNHISDYNSRVTQISEKFFSDTIAETRQSIKERILKFGFVAAGSYERELSRMSGLVNSIANSGLQTISPKVSAAYAPAVNHALAAFSVAQNLDSLQNNVDGKSLPTDNLGPIDTAISWLFPNLYNMMAKTKSGDPVADMISLGHMLLGMAAFATLLIIVSDMGVFGVFGAALSGAPGGPAGMAVSGAAVAALQAVGSRLIGMMTFFVTAFAVIGVLHAYVLPMIPMIMVFMMSLSWLILFLEASIAGVLWAFAFIRMDGQDFFDKNQAPGVTLIFNLFLRPALGMLAFIGGLAILPSLLNALNMIWMESYDSQVGAGGWLGLVKYVVGLIMFSYMQWQLVLRTYAIIPTIADRVGHWMGFGSSHGYGDGQETGNMTAAVLGGAVATSRMGDHLLSGNRQRAPGPKANPKANPKVNPKTGREGDSSENSGGEIKKVPDIP